MKQWFLYPDPLSELQLLAFMNCYHLKPGEVVVLEAYSNFAGDGVRFMYYTEKDLSV